MESAFSNILPIHIFKREQKSIDVNMLDAKPNKERLKLYSNVQYMYCMRVYVVWAAVVEKFHECEGLMHKMVGKGKYVSVTH